MGGADAHRGCAALRRPELRRGRGVAHGRGVSSAAAARGGRGKILRSVARFRLHRHRFLQENMSFAEFFKIYRIFKLKFLKFGKILQIATLILQIFAEFSRKFKIADFSNRFFAKILRLQRCNRMQIL